jgi:hypothetical protein
MELDKIIEAAEGKELGSDVIAAIKALDTSGDVSRLEGELKAEQAKSNSILEDKKRYKTERDAHKTALDQIETDKLPTEDQHKKALETMQAQLDEGKRLREEQQSGFDAKNRENTLLKINSGIDWDLKKCPAKTAQLLTNSAFTGIDDFTDDKVSEVVKTLTESHPHFITASAPSGTGGQPSGGGGGGGSDNKSSSMKEIMADVWKTN